MTGSGPNTYFVAGANRGAGEALRRVRRLDHGRRAGGGEDRLVPVMSVSLCSCVDGGRWFGEHGYMHDSAQPFTRPFPVSTPQSTNQSTCLDLDVLGSDHQLLDKERAVTERLGRLQT